MNRESYDRFQPEEIETHNGRCFVCNRKLGKNPATVTCEDEQDVFVGQECYKLIENAGVEGYLRPADKDGIRGPRLFLLKFDPKKRLPFNTGRGN